jgi:hypothetical protein
VGDGGNEFASCLFHLALALRRVFQGSRHAVEIVGQPGDLVVAIDTNLRAQLTSCDPFRPGPHALDAAGQRHRVEQGETDREGRREGQHRQEQREVMSRDEHGPRACEHHPEEQEAPDQACPHELRPHAAESPEYGGADEEQRKQPTAAAGHGE